MQEPPAPHPVEEWGPVFTKSFTDDQILNPAYALTTATPPSGQFTWCNLCDAPVPRGQSGEAHLAEHGRELRSWKRRRASEARRAARDNLRLVNRLRRETK